VSRTQRDRPLPECSICGTPTRRQAHTANGGLCSPCRVTYQASRGAQTQLLLSVPDVVERDLENVVVLDPRRRRKGGQR
jgi:hypothetical protein